MWFGLPFGGFPMARVGWRLPASPAAWMRPSPAIRAVLPSNFSWQRALAYRSGSRTPQGAAQWRAQFDALAQRSLQKYQQTVPGATKLANPSAMQAILRDLQNARVSRNDMQVRAKAAELRIITAYLRRPDVASVRVVPSSNAGRTPDLVVTYRGGRPPERVEVRTMTGSTPGWRRTPAVPGTRAFESERLARAIDAKIRRGQLTAPLPGVGSGGTIAIRMEARAPQAEATAREAIDRLASRLVGTPQVQRIEVHTGSRLLAFVRQRDGRYAPSFSDRLPLGVERAQARQRTTARRRMPARRRSRR
jgi:hypothetical protein